MLRGNVIVYIVNELLREPPTNREKRLSRGSRKTSAQNASQRLGGAF
jgi:hypothetical protein